MSIEITDVCESMLDEIESLEKRCFTPPWTVKQLKTQLNPGHIFIAAIESGRVCGYVGLQYVLDEGYISNIAVLPEMRRRGIADALLFELEQRSRELSLAFATLEVRESNAAARRLYEKHGFVQVGIRKNYYAQPRENAVLMTLELEKCENLEH